MHERTQRAIARMTFLFCCALPTMAVLAILVLTWTPWWHRRSLASIESQLSRATGLTIRVSDFRRSAPSTLTLMSVRAVDPETSVEVARVRQVVVTDRGEERRITLQQPDLHSAQLPHTWKMIHERFLCRPEQTMRSIQLSANDLTIHSQSGPITLRDVDAWIRPGLIPDTVEATIECLPADGIVSSQPPGPVRISVTRDRSGEDPVTTWVLSTSETPLPCSALAEYLPQLAGLGEDAMFAGTMYWTVWRDGWGINLGDSQFTGIALGSWCENLPHRLTGTAAIGLRRCQLVVRNGNPEKVDIVGNFTARDGLVGSSLLDSARQHLAFAIATELGHVVAYDQLAFDFDLNGTLLTLTGAASGFDGLQPDIVISAAGHPIARSSHDTLQATRLQSVFAPEHSVKVPLSQQTSPLMKLLMPPSRSTPLSDGPPPRITTQRPLDGEPSIFQPH